MSKTQIHLNLGTAANAPLIVSKSPIGGEPFDWNALFAGWYAAGKLLDYSSATSDKVTVNGSNRVTSMAGTIGGKTWTAVAGREPLYRGTFNNVPAIYYHDARIDTLQWNGTYPVGLNNQAGHLAMVYLESDNAAVRSVIGSAQNTSTRHMLRLRAKVQPEFVLGTQPACHAGAIPTNRWVLIGGSWKVGSLSSSAVVYAWQAGKPDQVVSGTGTGTATETNCLMGNSSLTVSSGPMEGNIGDEWMFPIEVLNNPTNFATYVQPVIDFCAAKYNLVFD